MRNKLFAMIIVVLTASFPALATETGFIQVKCTPGVQIFLDGDLKGITNTDVGGLIIQNVSPGQHEIKAVKEGYRPEIERISVQTGQVVAFEVKPFIPQVRISQIGDARQTEVKLKVGKIVIQSLPIECKLNIKVLGVNDMEKTKDYWEAEGVPVGKYEIVAESIGKKLSYEVEINEESTAEIFFNFINGEIKDIGATGWEEESPVIIAPETLESISTKLLSDGVTLSSRTARDLYEEARTKYQDGQYRDALPYLKSALVEAQSPAERQQLELILEYIYVQIIEALHQTGNWNESIHFVDEAYKAFPESKHLDSLYNTAHRESIPDSARAMLEQAIEKHGEKAYEKAILLYKQALPSLNSHYGTKARLGIASCHQGIFEQCYDDAKRAYEESRWLASLAFIATADLHQPGNSYLAILKKEAIVQRVGELLTMAERCLSEQKYTTPANDNAFDKYQQVLEFDPNNPTAVQGMEKIYGYYYQQGETALAASDYARSQAYFNKCLEVKPGDAKAAARLTDIDQQKWAAVKVEKEREQHEARLSQVMKEGDASLARLEHYAAARYFEYYLVLSPGNRTAEKKLQALKRAVDLGGGVKIELVWIPPGTFRMGSSDSEADRGNDEGPRHQVKVSHGFWMGKYEITQAQWEEVMESNPSSFKDYSHPVERVSWAACQAFLKKLSSRTGKAFRLPTEAEWEYACRARTKTAFHYGDSLSSMQANFNGSYPYGKALKGLYIATTMPVGTYRPNSFGLYDMHGNVWEWCQDWYDEDFYKTIPTNDPSGPSMGKHRVLRGGSLKVSADHCRSANRYGYRPTRRDNDIGFRILCSSLDD